MALLEVGKLAVVALLGGGAIFFTARDLYRAYRNWPPPDYGRGMRTDDDYTPPLVRCEPFTVPGGHGYGLWAYFGPKRTSVMFVQRFDSFAECCAARDKQVADGHAVTE